MEKENDTAIDIDCWIGYWLTRMQQGPNYACTLRSCIFHSYYRIDFGRNAADVRDCICILCDCTFFCTLRLYMYFFFWKRPIVSFNFLRFSLPNQSDSESIFCFRFQITSYSSRSSYTTNSDLSLLSLSHNRPLYHFISYSFGVFCGHGFEWNSQHKALEKSTKK